MSKVPDGLRDDLASAIAQEGSSAGSTKSLRAASNELRATERVLEATTTTRKVGSSTDNGVLVVTDQRILFVRAGALSAATEEIPFANVSGVLDRKGLLLAKIVVTGAGGITTAFVNISKRRVSPIMDAIRFHLTPHPGSVALPVPSAADEIRKLAELRDAGILTEEEFTTKKRQLLGL